MPRVTVIIATYNWATVLPFSIASVLDQTYTDFELLVIGDGCTDESAEVVEAIEDPRVQWHNLAENVGHQSGPNNEGLRRAAGDVVAYLGHDDLWLPSHLESLVGTLDGAKGRGGRSAHATTLLVEPGEPPSRWPTHRWRYVPGVWIPPTSMAHDRDLAVAVGGWHRPLDTGTLDPEAELWQRMAQASSPPRWARRTTCVKLSAALRRGVYRDRPHDEQEEWLRTIRSHADPEAAFERIYPESAKHARTFRQRAVQRMRDTVQLRTRLRRIGLLPERPETTAEERRLAYRVVKGLDDPPEDTKPGP
jgi:glycosyltransferase involved in cell wall biosynthesis